MIVTTPNNESMCAEGGVYTLAGPGEKKIATIRKRDVYTHNFRDGSIASPWDSD